MKILFVSPEYHPYGIGGGSAVYKQLVKYFLAKGHEVVVMYGYHPTASLFEKIKKYKKEGVTFYQIPLIPTPKSLPLLKTRFPCNIYSYFKISAIIREIKPDVAHLHGCGFPFVDIVGRNLIKQNIPYIMTNHGNPGKIFKSNKIIKFVWSIYGKLLLNPVLSKAYKITFVSDFTKNEPTNGYLEKSVTIYNGIDSDYPQITKHTLDIRKKYRILSGSKVILSLGRISEMKGIREMILALPGLIKKGLRFKYLIMGHVGDLSYKALLNSLISKLKLEDYIEFLGYLPENEKKQYIEQSDIVAIPSLWEGFGLVVLEAMIFNKIIITANMGSLPEVHENYKKVIHLNDENITKKIAEKEKIMTKFDFQEFSWDKISDTYLDLLTKANKAIYRAHQNRDGILQS